MIAVDMQMRRTSVYPKRTTASGTEEIRLLSLPRSMGELATRRIEAVSGMGYIAQLLAQPNTRFAAETLKGTAVRLANNPRLRVLREDAAEVEDQQVFVTQDQGQDCHCDCG